MIAVRVLTTIAVLSSTAMMATLPGVQLTDDIVFVVGLLVGMILVATWLPVFVKK